MLFFVSLFLEKKDAIWMQQKLRGFKDNRESKKKMTHEVFCRRRMLLPKLRLESTQTQDWILLDMLNELIRCPKSLYERLQGEDREKFKVPCRRRLRCRARAFQKHIGKTPRPFLLLCIALFRL